MCVSRKRKRLSDQIREAIDVSGFSRYQIAKKTGIDQASMSRFMNGKAGLELAALDRIGELLGLELKVRGRTRARKGK